MIIEVSRLSKILTQVKEELKRYGIDEKQARYIKIDRFGCVVLKIFEDESDTCHIGFLRKELYNFSSGFRSKGNDEPYDEGMLEWTFYEKEKI